MLPRLWLALISMSAAAPAAAGPARAILVSAALKGGKVEAVEITSEQPVEKVAYPGSVLSGAPLDTASTPTRGRGFEIDDAEYRFPRKV